MTEASPKIAIESQILRIPIFFNNTPRGRQQASNSSASNQAETQRVVKNCQCPHVLVSDDDPFQAFYYQTLFQKSMDFDNLEFEKKDFRFGLFNCGEDLLKKYQEITKCGCGSVLLVITDYSMGSDKLNGVQTILTLRRAGYNGNVVLRTSEKQDYLSQRHRDFTTLLKNKTVTCYINKDNHVLTKETIQEFLKNKI